AGNNHLRILVANSALNYMAGRRLPDYRLLNLRYGERFQAQDMDKVEAIPAGLLGAIRLVAVSPHLGALAFKPLTASPEFFCESVDCLPSLLDNPSRVVEVDWLVHFYPRKSLHSIRDDI